MMITFFAIFFYHEHTWGMFCGTRIQLHISITLCVCACSYVCRAATLCTADQYVSTNACEACAAGKTNAADDVASGDDTTCDGMWIDVANPKRLFNALPIKIKLFWMESIKSVIVHVCNWCCRCACIWWFCQPHSIKRCVLQRRLGVRLMKCR